MDRQSRGGRAGPGDGALPTRLRARSRPRGLGGADTEGGRPAPPSPALRGQGPGADCSAPASSSESRGLHPSPAADLSNGDLRCRFHPAERDGREGPFPSRVRSVRSPNGDRGSCSRQRRCQKHPHACVCVCVRTHALTLSGAELLGGRSVSREFIRKGKNDLKTGISFRL